MQTLDFLTKQPLKGELFVPGDKSISHRAVMFGSLAKGTTEVTHFLQGADCLSTIDCFQKLGIAIENTGKTITVHGKGLHGLQAPSQCLDTGNSGTTTRLIAGILSGQKFSSQLTGDESICRRPMNRIIEPLTKMGAKIESLKQNGCTPLTIIGQPLHGIHYQSPVASAQVKSAILLAGLYADDIVSVTEPALSRNHTELMLSGFGAHVTAHQTTASIEPSPTLVGQQITVPGDISSAAYFIAAALLVQGSQVLLKNVGINPTRNGILTVAQEMGGNISLLNQRTAGGEDVADILVQSSTLSGTIIEGKLIPTLIDEIPMIAIMACFASGTTIIRDAGELKVKESNRIDVMVQNLKAMGAHIEATFDGMIIEGGFPLSGAVIDTHKDHRIAMAFSIAALLCKGSLTLTDTACINISYPQFFEQLNSL